MSQTAQGLGPLCRATPGCLRRARSLPLCRPIWRVVRPWWRRGARATGANADLQSGLYSTGVDPAPARLQQQDFARYLADAGPLPKPFDPVTEQLSVAKDAGLQWFVDRGARADARGDALTHGLNGLGYAGLDMAMPGNSEELALTAAGPGIGRAAGAVYRNALRAFPVLGDDALAAVKRLATHVADNAARPGPYPGSLRAQLGMINFRGETPWPRPGGGNGTIILDPSRKGRLLGTGGNKEVFAYGDDQAVGLLQPGEPDTNLINELSLLQQLASRGLPVVQAEGPVSLVDRLGLLYERMAQGSKDVVAIKGDKARVVGDSPFLNERSRADLQKIRQMMIDENVKVDDLQFLIGEDGRIVISDPLKVLDQAPSNKNRQMIDLLIQKSRTGAK